jgi:hypothetical protein
VIVVKAPERITAAFGRAYDDGHTVEVTFKVPAVAGRYS